MLGAWELPKPGVLVAMLTRGQVTTRWAISFRNLQLPPNSNFEFIEALPFHHARNEAAGDMLKGGFQWLFFLDDDVIPPDDVIYRLMSRGADIVSGLYYRRKHPIYPVAMMEMPNGEKSVYIPNLELGKMYDVHMVGAGCLLIHRRVFETVPRPWFEWRADRMDLPEPERCSEDYAFCKNARKYGFKVYLDTSVQCHHIGLSRSSAPGEFAPLDG
jgi:hypothetical protein